MKKKNYLSLTSIGLALLLSIFSGSMIGGIVSNAESNQQLDLYEEGTNRTSEVEYESDIAVSENELEKKKILKIMK